jgi:hypothetical protein
MFVSEENARSMIGQKVREFDAQTITSQGAIGTVLMVKHEQLWSDTPVADGHPGKASTLLDNWTVLVDWPQWAGEAARKRWHSPRELV